MLRPEVNIVVVHSRFQLLIVQHMLETTPELAADQWLVLDMRASDVPLQQDLWTGVLELTPPVGGTVIGTGRVCRRAMAQVLAVANQYKGVRLLVSDIQWPLNNALYGALVRRSRNRAALETFPDGIGSLQIVYPSRWHRMKDLLKAALGTVGGVPFTLFAGDVMGLELSEHVYSLMPEAIPQIGGRTTRIHPLSTTKIPVDCDSVLFVGQNYEAFVPRARYRQIATSAARFTKGLGYRNLLYKPHPLERTTEAREIFRTQGFELLDDSRTVEEIFFVRRLACAVSYNSSALVHLKLLFGDDVRCVAIHNRDVLRHTRVEEGAREKMEAVFALSGVEDHK